jgi:hypothetical protein
LITTPSSIVESTIERTRDLAALADPRSLPVHAGEHLRPTTTSGPIHAESGSTIVTPAAISSSFFVAWNRPTSASSLRLFT